MTKKLNGKDIISSFKKHMGQNSYPAEAINFFNSLRLKDKLIFELAADGLSYEEISNRLGYSPKDVQDKIYEAYQSFLKPGNSKGFYRLKVIRNSFKIMQGQMGDALGKTLDAYSKYERGEINLEGENAEERILSIVLENARKSDVYMKIKNNEISSDTWQLYFSQAALTVHLNIIDKIMKSKNNTLKAILFGVLENFLAHNLFMGKYMNALIKVSHIDIFESAEGLNISKIQKEITKGADKAVSVNEMIGIANAVSVYEEVKLNGSFIKISEEFLKVYWLREFYIATINYIAGIFKGNKQDSAEVYRLLLFEPDMPGAGEIKNINNLMDSYNESLKKL
jgi:transcriptional regulator with XRE-family HTH domain